MIAGNLLRNPVSPKMLKINHFFEKENLKLVLKKDIWKKNTLILKSGKCLNQEILEKIINFGISEIYVNYEHKLNPDMDLLNNLKQNFLSSQKVLIIENDQKNTNIVVKFLQKKGFQDKNIIISNNVNSIDLYFAKSLHYIYVDFDLYNQMDDTLKSNVSSAYHKFIMYNFDLDLQKNNDLDYLIKNISAQVIIKPVITSYFEYALDKCITSDFGKWLKNNELSYLADLA